MLLEFFFRVMQAAFHRADRNVKALGNFLLRQILEKLEVFSKSWTAVEQCMIDLHSIQSDGKSNAEKFDFRCKKKEY